MKDHLIKMGNGLFYIPDGTDRVYELIIEKNRPSFIRRDNSFFSGHTFHALNFPYKDSIYSFSGFGFGHHNSQLRVFNMGTGNWRSIKLNQDVAISFRSSPGVWVNTNTGKLWTISHLKTDLAQNFSAFTAENCDSIPVRYLDFSSGQWKSVGELNPVMLNSLKANTRIGSCPWGELTLDTARLQVGLINYNENRMMYLNPLKSKEIVEALLRIQRKHSRVYSWFSSGNFMLADEQGNMSAYPILISDFNKGDFIVYEKLSEAWSFSGPMILSAVVFISGIVFFLLSFVRPRIKRPDFRKNISVTMELIFTEFELQILRTLSENSGHELNTEQVNLILGTSKKTIEVQKKQRSDTIKSINEKYKRLMDDLEPLIVQDRLEDDRRQVRYLLNLEKYAILLNRIIG